MFTRIIVAAVALCAAVAAASCSVEQDAQALGEAMRAAAEAAQAAQQQGTPQQQPGAMADPDASLFQKLGGYIDCINSTSGSVRDSYDRYLSWVNKKKGPTCKEPYISYGVFELGTSSTQTCNNAVAQGRMIQPPLPEVDAAAAQVAGIFAQLQPLNDKAESYYEQEDYKDDNCAFAKSSHAQLISLYEQFIAAMDNLKRAVDKVKDEADVRQLANMERAMGRNFQWQVKRIMIYAKRVADVFPDGQDPKKVKKEAYLPQYAQFEPIYQEFEAYAAAQKAEIDNVMWGSSFVDSTKEFYTQAKLIRRDFEGAKKIKPRKFNEFITAYNNFIRDAGNLSL